MKFGNFEIHAVLDGFFVLDGGAMFGRVPREVWKKTNPPDRQNRILLALRCLLIKTGKRNIIVDTGIGGKHDRKFLQRFVVNRKVGLEGELKRLGLGPEDIDIVVNTHLHFDHCGGNTKKEKGKISRVFPKAEYLVQKGEWCEAFLIDNPLTQASYYQEDFLGVVSFVEEDRVEIERGIALVKTGGHTKDHQIVEIESGGKKAIYLGDLVPTASHLKYPFIMGYDVEPLETLKKKMEILPKAAEEKTLLIFEHEPKFAAAFIGKKDGEISIIEEVAL